MLKLVRSGRSLREAKALMKVGTVALTTEYAKAGDLKDLQNLEGGLHRIRQTRNDARLDNCVRRSHRAHRHGSSASALPNDDRASCRE